ncbi:hypothetical protein [Actinotalea sp. K2]|uniref:hypothetical protein n=1 Tax=Actinotalea sp. K2 TaxID=2939438 RepID=UPI002016ABFC|nr:hypothetical protein [Actinotalea sp. K2]MCL3862511.1 hypothetical protein [Actinotalea sp. K2]
MNLGGFVLLGISPLAFALACRSLLRPSGWREVVVMLLQRAAGVAMVWLCAVGVRLAAAGRVSPAR